MSAQSTFEFRLLSPLGASVVLFLIYGGLYILIGILTPFFQDTETGRQTLFTSPRPDTIVFRQKPVELLTSDTALSRLRTILLRVIAGLLVTAGCFHLAITWFGLRQGQSWALVALTVGALVVLPFWFAALRPYFQPGVDLSLGDIPPFMWVPAALLLPAFILGWIGLS